MLSDNKDLIEEIFNGFVAAPELKAAKSAESIQIELLNRKQIAARRKEFLVNNEFTLGNYAGNIDRAFKKHLEIIESTSNKTAKAGLEKKFNNFWSAELIKRASPNYRPDSFEVDFFPQGHESASKIIENHFGRPKDMESMKYSYLLFKAHDLAMRKDLNNSEDSKFINYFTSMNTVIPPQKINKAAIGKSSSSIILGGMGPKLVQTLTNGDLMEMRTELVVRKLLKEGNDDISFAIAGDKFQAIDNELKADLIIGTKKANITLVNDKANASNETNLNRKSEYEDLGIIVLNHSEAKLINGKEIQTLRNLDSLEQEIKTIIHHDNKLENNSFRHTRNQADKKIEAFYKILKEDIGMNPGEIIKLDSDKDTKNIKIEKAIFETLKAEN